MNDKFESTQPATNAEEMYEAFIATGCTGNTSKEDFIERKPLLQSRMLRAAQEQFNDKDRFLLHDPIEDDPSTAEIVKWAHRTADKKIFPHRYFGRCHELWEMQADLLLKKHNIVWFSVQEMNGCIIFD
jgi:hypothetical protein